MLRDDVMDLWQLCFHDDERFVKMFFSKVYRDDYVRIIRGREGNIICELQLLPYSMKYYNHVLDTAYIAGVATQINYRNKGYMPKLMKSSMCELYNKNYSIATLIPGESWLYDYYKRYGFTQSFYCGIERYDYTYNFETLDNITISEDVSINDLYTFISSIENKRACCVLHAKDNIEALVLDNKIYGGRVIAIIENTKICGVAFVINDDSEIWINDLFVEPKYKLSLLYAVRSIYPNILINCRLMLNNSLQRQRFGMLRIINVENVLTAYASYNKNIECSFRIYDPIIQNNNTTYKVKDGKCSKCYETVPVDYDIDISDLSNILFKGNDSSMLENLPSVNAFMILMLN